MCGIKMCENNDDSQKHTRDRPAHNHRVVLNINPSCTAFFLSFSFNSTQA